MNFRWMPSLLLVVLGGLVGGCGVVSERPTGNQMMLVRESPETTGYRKLKIRVQQSEDLQIFIQKKGLPDFLAEASNGGRDYLIFYYLKQHQAYACRMKGKRGENVEFAGPYPMTDGEWKLLNGVKSQIDKNLAIP